MDIVGIVTNLISGAVGGNLSGAALKQMSLGAIGNTIAGAIGGTAGSYILQLMGILSAAGITSMSVESLATTAGSSAVFGAVITAIVGFIKNQVAK